MGRSHLRFDAESCFSFTHTFLEATLLRECQREFSSQPSITGIDRERPPRDSLPLGGPLRTTPFHKKPVQRNVMRKALGERGELLKCGSTPFDLSD